MEKRRYVFACLTPEEYAVFEQMRAAEQCTISNLVRRALFTMADEMGLDAPFGDRHKGNPQSEHAR